MKRFSMLPPVSSAVGAALAGALSLAQPTPASADGCMTGDAEFSVECPLCDTTETGETAVCEEFYGARYTSTWEQSCDGRCNWQDHVVGGGGPCKCSE